MLSASGPIRGGGGGGGGWGMLFTLQTDDVIAMLENADMLCSAISDDSCDDEPMTTNLAT